MKKIIPGREREADESFGLFQQAGSLDGTLTRIGGRTDFVPVHIELDGHTQMCQATRNVAKEIAPYIFGEPLRVFGKGTWERDADGAWLMHRFAIERFEVLENQPLDDVLEEARSLPRRASPASLEELETLRHGSDD